MSTDYQDSHPSIQISSIKRIRGKAILQLSNGTTLSMPRVMLKESPYRSGMVFDRSSFDTFLIDRSYSYALEKAIRLLAARSRTEKEIEISLRQNAYPEITITRVMERLLKANYLNDSEFAANWAASRSTKGIGVSRIRMELRQKGIAQEEIDSALEALEDADIIVSAIKVAEKSARGKDLSSREDQQKVIAALVRRGYDFSVARRALLDILNQSE